MKRLLCTISWHLFCNDHYFVCNNGLSTPAEFGGRVSWCTRSPSQPSASGEPLLYMNTERNSSPKKESPEEAGSEKSISEKSESEPTLNGSDKSVPGTGTSSAAEIVPVITLYILHSRFGSVPLCLYICKYCSQDVVARLAMSINKSEWRAREGYARTKENTWRVDLRLGDDLDATICNVTSFLTIFFRKEGFKLRSSAIHPPHGSDDRTSWFFTFTPLEKKH